MAALRQALQKRKPAPTMLFHLDRGVECAAGGYRALLAKHHIKPSMNCPGGCTDDARIESFFLSLKGEWINGVDYATVNTLRQAIKDYIVHFYNRTRLYSILNYLSPNDFERQLVQLKPCPFL